MKKDKSRRPLQDLNINIVDLNKSLETSDTNAKKSTNRVAVVSPPPITVAVKSKQPSFDHIASATSPSQILKSRENKLLTTTSFRLALIALVMILIYCCRPSSFFVAEQSLDPSPVTTSRMDIKEAQVNTSKSEVKEDVLLPPASTPPLSSMGEFIATPIPESQLVDVAATPSEWSLKEVVSPPPPPNMSISIVIVTHKSSTSSSSSFPIRSIESVWGRLVRLLVTLGRRLLKGGKHLLGNVARSMQRILGI